MKAPAAAEAALSRNKRDGLKEDCLGQEEMRDTI